MKEFFGNAWKFLDGSYRLSTRFQANSGEMERQHGEWGRAFDDEANRYVEDVKEQLRKAGGRWDENSASWIVPRSVIDWLGLETIFVVVVAGYCCRGPSRAEARSYQVRRGMIVRVFCETCGKRPRGSTLWEVPILEFCGEGEEGQITYEAAFRDEIEGR